MKNKIKIRHKKNVLQKVEEKRFKRRIKSKNKKRNKSSRSSNNSHSSKKNRKVKKPVNLDYILNCKESNFYFKEKIKFHDNENVYKIPEVFSLINNAKPSYLFIVNVLKSLINEQYDVIKIDYSSCKTLDLSAQVFFDIVLKDVFSYLNEKNKKHGKVKINKIEGIGVRGENIKKLLFSVGSPVVHNNCQKYFDDIIPYKLCIHDGTDNDKSLKTREQKDIDTTKLVDYVIDSLKALDRTLTPEKIDDLCTIIGEILINAEEHSSTKHRFSIGFFTRVRNDSDSYGVFRLVILNFGRTIYEKFKDKDCPNKNIVKKMEALSEQYTKRRWFEERFQEETLWTLYALQEGVTSVSTEEYKKRGNGSIQFIESFFSLRGMNNTKDKVSTLTILSGNTCIVFDGTYNIIEKNKNNETYRVMAFNETGDLEDKPDSKYVKYVKNYFPGTLIDVEIMFTEDDFVIKE